MKIRHLAIVAAGVAFTSSASAADFVALSGNGRTLSVVDFVKGKVINSVELTKSDQLTTISYQPDTKELWGITKEKSLIRMNSKTFKVIFRGEPLGDVVELDYPFLDWLGSAFLVLSNREIAPLNGDGTLKKPLRLFKNPDDKGVPKLAAFTLAINQSSKGQSAYFGMDAKSDTLLLPPKDGPIWVKGPKLSRSVDTPTAFEAINENGATKGYAVVGKTLWNVNLKNGEFTKPRNIKGLQNDVFAMTFITKPLQAQAFE